MYNDIGKKLEAIRIAEELTYTDFCKLTGISKSAVKNYENGQVEVGLKTVQKFLNVNRFHKYTLWLMIGKTCEEAGQISPALTHSGPEKTE